MASKSGLKTHLSSTAVFKDYDFDGSGLSVMLDLLAYTTYLQAVYNNFVANEMFITSAEEKDTLLYLMQKLLDTLHRRSLLPRQQ